MSLAPKIAPGPFRVVRKKAHYKPNPNRKRRGQGGALKDATRHQVNMSNRGMLGDAVREMSKRGRIPSGSDMSTLRKTFGVDNDDSADSRNRAPSGMGVAPKSERVYVPGSGMVEPGRAAMLLRNRARNIDPKTGMMRKPKIIGEPRAEISMGGRTFTFKGRDTRISDPTVGKSAGGLQNLADLKAAGRINQGVQQRRMADEDANEQGRIARSVASGGGSNQQALRDTEYYDDKPQLQKLIQDERAPQPGYHEQALDRQLGYRQERDNVEAWARSQVQDERAAASNRYESMVGSFVAQGMTPDAARRYLALQPTGQEYVNRGVLGAPGNIPRVPSIQQPEPAAPGGDVDPIDFSQHNPLLAVGGELSPMEMKQAMEKFGPWAGNVQTERVYPEELGTQPLSGGMEMKQAMERFGPWAFGNVRTQGVSPNRFVPGPDDIGQGLQHPFHRSGPSPDNNYDPGFFPDVSVPPGPVQSIPPDGPTDGSFGPSSLRDFILRNEGMPGKPWERGAARTMEYTPEDAMANQGAGLRTMEVKPGEQGTFGGPQNYAAGAPNTAPQPGPLYAAGPAAQATPQAPGYGTPGPVPQNAPRNPVSAGYGSENARLPRALPGENQPWDLNSITAEQQMEIAREMSRQRAIPRANETTPGGNPRYNVPGPERMPRVGKAISPDAAQAQAGMGYMGQSPVTNAGIPGSAQYDPYSDPAALNRMAATRGQAGASGGGFNLPKTTEEILAIQQGESNKMVTDLTVKGEKQRQAIEAQDQGIKFDKSGNIVEDDGTGGARYTGNTQEREAQQAADATMIMDSLGEGVNESITKAITDMLPLIPGLPYSLTQIFGGESNSDVMNKAMKTAYRGMNDAFSKLPVQQRKVLAGKLQSMEGYKKLPENIKIAIEGQRKGGNWTPLDENKKYIPETDVWKQARGDT